MAHLSEKCAKLPVTAEVPFLKEREALPGLGLRGARVPSRGASRAAAGASGFRENDGSQQKKSLRAERIELF